MKGISVFNLSSLDLGDSTKKLLAKGCKFTPTAKKNLSNCENDVSDFCRRLRLKDYFNNDTSFQSSEIEIKNSCSNFTPSKGLNTNLDCIINLIENQVHTLFTEVTIKSYHNLPANERKSLNLLKNNDNLHITKADKGGGFVLLDYAFYKNRMINEHLSDETTYKRIDKYYPNETVKKIKQLCKSHENCCRFTSKEFKFLTNFDCETPFLYGLPKLHKHLETFSDVQPDEHKYIKVAAPHNLKFRPIISSTFAPTKNLSYFTDEILKPIVPILPSYCRDTQHFLSRLPKTLDGDNDNFTFVSFDVVSLYTSIPHALGLESIHFWLHTERQLISDRYCDDFIIKSLNLILTNNFFSFEDDIYIQNSGTAMGTKLAPTYAILVMGYLEYKMYKMIKQVYPEEISNAIVESWIRYIDDCWIIWESRFGDITDFHRILNDIHNDINFTIEFNKQELNFLDVRIYKEDNRIETDIHYKLTDSHNYLPYNSAHPKHVINNIPFCLANRIINIVSKPQLQRKRLNELENILMQLHYPIKLIHNCFQRALNKTNVSQNRSINTTSKNQRIPFISTFNKNNPNTYQKLIIPATHTLKLMDSFNDCKFFRSFKQPKSLLNILRRNNRKSLLGVHRCGETRCQACSIIITGTEINFYVNGQNKTFNITSNMNCQSKNIIYMIRCTGCHEIYLGQTGDMFRNRMTVHRQQITHKKYAILNVSRHISMCAANRFEAAPIYKLCPSASKFQREKKEQEFISMLRPKLNQC